MLGLIAIYHKICIERRMGEAEPQLHLNNTFRRRGTVWSLRKMAVLPLLVFPHIPLGTVKHEHDLVSKNIARLSRNRDLYLATVLFNVVAEAVRIVPLNNLWKVLRSISFGSIESVTWQPLEAGKSCSLSSASPPSIRDQSGPMITCITQREDV